MQFTPDLSEGDGPIEELYPLVATVASTYGDLNGHYANFLKGRDEGCPAMPWFLWNQPFSGLAAATPAGRPLLTPTSVSGNGAIGRAGIVVAGWVGMMLSIGITLF
jgi:hypothetical protein